METRIPARRAAAAPAKRRRSRRLRRLRHLVEGALLEAALWLFARLPLERASGLGGWLARRVGPLTGRHRVAAENLRLAFPRMTRDQRRRVLSGMWDNLGRTLAELAQLERIYPAGRVEIVGGEHIEALRDDGIGGVFVSAHYGNWELLSLSLGEYGVVPTMLYRRANNPWSERAIQRRRVAAQRLEGATYLPKTGRGVRGLVQALRRGGHIALLVDQKAREGVPVELLGRPTTASAAAAQMALKYAVPIVPARIDRLEGARFRLTVFPPMELPRSGDDEADAAELTRRMMALFEAWIEERPEQWLWLHRRWSGRAR